MRKSERVMKKGEKERNSDGEGKEGVKEQRRKGERSERETEKGPPTTVHVLHESELDWMKMNKYILFIHHVLMLNVHVEGTVNP